MLLSASAEICKKKVDRLLLLPPSSIRPPVLAVIQLTFPHQKKFSHPGTTCDGKPHGGEGFSCVCQGLYKCALVTYLA